MITFNEPTPEYIRRENLTFLHIEHGFIDPWMDEHPEV